MKLKLIFMDLKRQIMDCEKLKAGMSREADKIHVERECYNNIKELMGVLYDTERNDTESLKGA